MQPLNPFLRSFFKSVLPSQCLPSQHHVLLVPTTEVLLYGRDRETQARYSDLCNSEDFLASHVLRVPGGLAPAGNVRENGQPRESKTKAKQYSTVNGKTVVVKESFAYSNKGFRTLNQAQLLYDIVFWPDGPDAQQWIVYYISKPLVGIFESTAITPASLVPAKTPPVSNGASTTDSGADAESPQKKDVKSFADLLNSFPMIARQMQPGLERLFKEFGAEFEKPLPPLPNKPSSIKSRTSITSTEDGAPLTKSVSNSSTLRPPSSIILDDEEDAMRRALETAVTAAIDLFQMVDKQQLSLLGATTDLTGPLVERMIERYVTEQVHDSCLFPRICAIRKEKDAELESKIRQTVDIDISQVGIPIEGGQKGKRALAARLKKAGDVFRKMGVAGGPQEMMEILLSTQKAITVPEPVPAPPQPESIAISNPRSEKPADDLTINADTLVSMLLIVVVRSSVRKLQARLSYMRHFIFIDDVESGEMGYALSTFEAVISYLAKNSGGLRKASKQNRRLWQATKSGDVKMLRSIFHSGTVTGDESTFEEDPSGLDGSNVLDNGAGESTTNGVNVTANGSGDEEGLHAQTLTNDQSSQQQSLSHIFPFQRPPTPPPDVNPPKMKKRVSMASRHASISSAYSSGGRSSRSRSLLTDFADLELEGDISIETLSKTQGPNNGESVLMMAVESGQVESLRFLLRLQDIYPWDFVMEDTDSEGATLLSAAVQHGDQKIIESVLEFILNHAPSDNHIVTYFGRQDNKGRCVAHYLFNRPQLIPRIGSMLPWRLKDKNGQTPLFAMSRSYDHENYSWLVYNALEATKKTQEDDQILHLDDHVDAKGNTLLHTINDPQVTTTVLKTCDSDVNASNDKRFTPLMIASKYGRVEQVRALFADPRVDFLARDLRGFTAVELAKDDEVRNRIDDLALLSSAPGIDGRTTTVVRSFFVEDATVRLVIKSGAPSENNTITVTTCRRSVSDFQSLAQCLALEHPASWLPNVANLPSPFLLPSKPARALLRDIQFRLDAFLKTLLTHPSFATHELVWEFFLVPDIDMAMIAERSARKAETRAENVKEEYEAIAMNDVRDVELFVAHARDMVRGINFATRSIARRTNAQRIGLSDLYEAQQLTSSALSTIDFLPASHTKAFERFSHTLRQTDYSPLTHLFYSLSSQTATTAALLDALSRPSTLITKMQQATRAIDKQGSSLSRAATRFPFGSSRNANSNGNGGGGLGFGGLFEDTRKQLAEESARREAERRTELRTLGCELRYMQSTVASELSGWQGEREKVVRGLLREFVGKVVVVERDRLEGMRRAVRGLGLKVGESGRGWVSGGEVQRGKGKSRA
ncbi:MAG: hypothetical protein M1821_007764 [Bathelium mastoideum]|nr:MAG: hypothetical protein M1821_007764 [Bathelium mastoideum]